MSSVTTQIDAPDNPFDLLLRDSSHDPVKVQALYHTHRWTRNSQQKALVLDPAFSGWSLDDVLIKLEGPRRDPTYKDPRQNAIIWARPPESIQDLIAVIQQNLQDAVPSLWIMPRENLHMTTLEIATSLTEQELEDLFIPLQSHLSQIANYTYTHRARLIKPLISYDQAGLALSFLPAAGEGLVQSPRTTEEDRYTYHHLRRDIHQMAIDTGTPVRCRYVAPSAHITIARFLSNDEFMPGDKNGQIDSQKLEGFIKRIDSLNQWLQNTFWPQDFDGSIKPGGEWLVGEERGLDCQKGPVWYGHNHRVMIGQGFLRETSE
ncbi:hypothetical protein N7492_002108 [Penicillium capsulatum]|uniref:RNA ligase/cyclic nucleotide phosphodiesterase n=1 Tax=Penicillium capsulatum TaxID=69766 RepID=A0A9W9LUT9_9EURO|nr:hypothetical protein N7492_002108 [Penicillium capsulatum]KAJ6123280.1 hypothetical protein N7512_005745 [Penicillium capsulatum]